MFEIRPHYTERTIREVNPNFREIAYNGFLVTVPTRLALDIEALEVRIRDLEDLIISFGQLTTPYLIDAVNAHTSSILRKRQEVND